MESFYDSPKDVNEQKVHETVCSVHDKSVNWLGEQRRIETFPKIHSIDCSSSHLVIE